MRILSFLGYSIASIARNRRRSIYAMVGIALSTALITGSLLAVDISASGLLKAAIGSTTTDFLCQDYTLSDSGFNRSACDAAIRSIEELDDIAKASFWVTLNDWSLENSQGDQYLSFQGGVYLAFADAGNGAFLKGNAVNGGWPSNGTVAISRAVADKLNVSLGDPVVVSQNFNDITVDPVTGTREYGLISLKLNFPVSQIWTQDKVAGEYASDRPDLLDPNIVYLNNRQGVEPVLFDISSYASVMNSTVTGFMEEYGRPPPRLNYLVWTDRNAVIDISNLAGSVKKLDFIQARLDLVGRDHGFFAGNSPLEYQLGALNRDLDSMKLLFIELSVPVAVLGIYLSVIGVDLGANARRREAGLLKARGASVRLVLVHLVLEAVILGALAAVLGLVAGVVMSGLLFGAAPSLGTPSTYVISFSSAPGFGWTASLLAIAFGIVLMLLSSYGSFSKMSGTQVRESMPHYSAAASRDEYSSMADVLLVFFSVLSIASVYLTANAANGHGWSWITRTLVGALLTWGIVLFPFMPFMLSFGVVRLLTRGWRKLYARFSWIVRPWTKELHYLVQKNLLRNPRRASNLGVLISLALACALFVSITMESTLANQRNQAMFDCGSDMRVEGDWLGASLSPGRNLDIGHLSELGSTKGVESYVPYTVLLILPFPYASGTDVRGAVIDSTAYEEIARPSAHNFVGDGSHDIRDLETNGTAMMGLRVMDAYYMAIGDTVMFEFLASHWEGGVLKTIERQFPLTVIGTMATLPGLSNTDVIIDDGTMAWLTSQDISAAPMTVSAFITISPGADPHAVESAAKSVFTEAGLQSQAYLVTDMIAALERENGFWAMQAFLYLEYVLSVAIMAVGVGLLIFVTVDDRERELACAQARGLSGSQMRRMLMGESLTLTLIGLVVGTSVGLTASYLFNTLPQSATQVPKTMEMTLVSAVMLLVSVSSLMFASLLATAQAGKIRLAEVLRIRGG